MKIVQGDEIEWKRGLEYRGGTFHYRNLLEGEAGPSGISSCRWGATTRISCRRAIVTTSNSSVSSLKVIWIRPRWHDEARHGRYFPEGAHYGPQTSRWMR